MTERVKQMLSWIQEEEKEPMFQAPLSNTEVTQQPSYVTAVTA
jgi:hypothetical protein